MFTVLWLPRALNQLTAIWLAAADRPAITQASDRIDHRLRRDPEGESESRQGQDRVLFEAPLGVLIRVDAGDRKVYVLSVWRFR